MKKQQKKKPVKHEYWSFGEMNKALEVALYYGFNPITPAQMDKTGKEAAKGLTASNELAPKPEDKIALLRTYFAKNIPSSPVMVATAWNAKPKSRKLECSFDILGTPRPIADACVIKAAYETVKQEGYENPYLEINSLGDRESLSRFSRELANFLKKNSECLHNDCKTAMKKGPLNTLVCVHDKCADAMIDAPRPMNFLSEPSRAHFKELLELLEKAGVPYEINDTLIENPDFAMHTVFRIYSDAGKDKELIACGGRWGVLAKRTGLRKDVPSMSATVLITKPSRAQHKCKVRKPIFYFVQMGPEAKQKSLFVIETLRQSKVSTYHNLTNDKLTAQLQSAESLKVPYIIIMGQKESHDDTVLVRNMTNRSQETVKITSAGEYLRKLLL